MERHTITPDAVQAVLRTTVPMLDAMGMEVVEVAPGRVRLRLPFSTHNGNHIGSVYAGALFSFLEASGGALILVSLDVTRWIPVIVEGTIRYARPVTGPIEADLAMTDDERDGVHRTLEADPKARWTLTAAAVAADGRKACDADLVYRFRSPS